MSRYRHMPASLQQRRNSASCSTVTLVLSVTMLSASHLLCRCRSKRGADTACMAALYAGVLHSKRISSFLPYCRFVVPVLSILQETCRFCNKKSYICSIFPQSFPHFSPQSLAPQGLQVSCGFCVRERVRGRGRTQPLGLVSPRPFWGRITMPDHAYPTPFPLRFFQKKVFFFFDRNRRVSTSEGD